uniref:Uncharacterized protein n=1 Tax=Vitis vinifera TaxID=29760 RepID=F6HTD2_VITVI
MNLTQNDLFNNQ